jgi:hypothetical protein
MGLFESAAARERRRKLQIRRAMTFIQKEIANCRQHEKGYLEKAKRAKKIGDQEQFAKFRMAWRRTVSMQNQLERQLLDIEGMVQLKNQAEASSQFAQAMNAISKSISDLFGKIDFAQTRASLEKAHEQAQALQEEMDTMLDETTANIYSYTGEATRESVTDEEFERLMEDEVIHDEGKALDRELAAHMQDIERELKSK